MDANDATRALLLLNYLNQKRTDHTERFLNNANTPPASEYEQSYSDCPVVDAFYKINGDETIREMTNITLAELKGLFLIGKVSMCRMMSCRGLKFVDKLMDLWFM